LEEIKNHAMPMLIDYNKNQIYFQYYLIKQHQLQISLINHILLKISEKNENLHIYDLNFYHIKKIIQFSKQ